MNPDLRQNYAGVFDGRIGFGKSPALLLVDYIRAYSEAGSPLFMESTAAAVRSTGELLSRFRQAGLPVLYTRVIYNANGTDGGWFVRKVPVLRRMVEGEPLAGFIPSLAPQPGETIITKQYASAFFGTSLAATLTALTIDTLIITGVSTSGCVRATAVDAMQHGFRPIVPRECVADRNAAPHEANLFDINAKYGDVVGIDDVLSELSTR